MQRHRSRLRLVIATALAGAAVVVLLATRPSLPALSWSRGDDLTLAAAWLVALAASLWLFGVSAACLLAIGARRPRLAHVLARALPPALRRSVEIAIVASCLAVSTAPAHAANSDTAPVVDQPVVRAPRALSLSPTTIPGPARKPAPSTPRPTVAVTASPPTTAASRRAAPTTPSTPQSVPQPSAAARVVVRRGDNLWVIAQRELIRSTGTYPDDVHIARYWRAVIEANRSTLRSGNPSLVFPGEIVALPPVARVP